jgi:hypothetical protein
MSLNLKFKYGLLIKINDVLRIQIVLISFSRQRDFKFL